MIGKPTRMSWNRGQVKATGGSVLLQEGRWIDNGPKWTLSTVVTDFGK